jgi:hypothetical protein
MHVKERTCTHYIRSDMLQLFCYTSEVKTILKIAYHFVRVYQFLSAYRNVDADSTCELSVCL